LTLLAQSRLIVGLLYVTVNYCIVKILNGVGKDSSKAFYLFIKLLSLFLYHTDDRCNLANHLALN